MPTPRRQHAHAAKLSSSLAEFAAERIRNSAKLSLSLAEIPPRRQHTRKSPKEFGPQVQLGFALKTSGPLLFEDPDDDTWDGGVAGGAPVWLDGAREWLPDAETRGAAPRIDDARSRERSRRAAPPGRAARSGVRAAARGASSARYTRRATTRRTRTTARSTSSAARRARRRTGPRPSRAFAARIFLL